MWQAIGVLTLIFLNLVALGLLVMAFTIGNWVGLLFFAGAVGALALSIRLMELLMTDEG